MNWTVEWLPEAAEDFRSLNGSQRPLMLKAIQAKIAFDPEQFGEPLRANAETPLPGFRRLRVGSLRIIYFVFQNAVKVNAIDKRADNTVYEKASERIKKLRQLVQSESEEIDELLRRYFDQQGS